MKRSCLFQGVGLLFDNRSAAEPVVPRKDGRFLVREPGGAIRELFSVPLVFGKRDPVFRRMLVVRNVGSATRSLVLKVKVQAEKVDSSSPKECDDFHHGATLPSSEVSLFSLLFSLSGAG